MSRFSGPQPGYKYPERPFGNNGPKGVLRAHREKLRIEAEARNELTDPEKRASFRRAQLEEVANEGHVTRSEARKIRKRTRKGKSTSSASGNSDDHNSHARTD